MTVNQLAPEHPGPPIHIHMPAAANGGSAVKVAIIGAFSLIAVGVLGVFGDQMFSAIGKVAASVSDVHDLANANLEAQREIARVAEEKTEAMRAELAAANARIAELSERIGGMVPAPPPVPPEGVTP